MMKIYKLRSIDNKKYWTGGNLYYKTESFEDNFNKNGKIWIKETYLKSALLNVFNAEHKTITDTKYFNYLMNNCEVIVYEVIESEILNPKDIVK